MKKILATSLVTLLLVACGSTEPEPQFVSSIEVTPPSLSLTVDFARPWLSEGVKLSAVARDVDGNPVSATFEWRTSNGDVATVSSEGVVTGGSHACLAKVTAHVGYVASNVVPVTVTGLGGSANSAESASCGG